MSTSGEVADLMAKETLQFAEVVAKLTATGAKNLAVLLFAVAKGNRKVVGKASLNRLVKEGRPLLVFRMNEQDLEKFHGLAKQYGVLYAAVKKKDAGDGFCELLVKDDDVAKMNHIFESMGYAVPTQEQGAQKKTNRAARQKTNSAEPRNGSTVSTRTTSDRPSVKGRLAAFKAAEGAQAPKHPPVRTKPKVR